MKVNYVCEKNYLKDCKEGAELGISRKNEGLVIGRKENEDLIESYKVLIIKTLYGAPIDERDTGIINPRVSRYKPSIGKYGSLQINLTEDGGALRLYNPRTALNEVCLRERETGEKWELRPGSEFYLKENKKSVLDIYIGEYVGTLRIEPE